MTAVVVVAFCVAGCRLVKCRSKKWEQQDHRSTHMLLKEIRTFLNFQSRALRESWHRRPFATRQMIAVTKWWCILHLQFAILLPIMPLDKLWWSKLVQWDSSLQLKMSTIAASTTSSSTNSTTAMDVDYPDPPWAGTPPAEHPCYLLEIKPVVSVTHHHLSVWPCTVLGWAADQVHIALVHELCSRQYARIAFDKIMHVPWLWDLSSTHRMTINKQSLPSIVIGRMESMLTKAGSWGVVLYPGDVIQFGASTRLICVEGLEIFSKECIRTAQQESQLKLEMSPSWSWKWNSKKL